MLADLPGLIEGASSGKGLGHDFLRHVDRTRVLLFLIDVTSPHPQEDLQVLKNELRAWKSDLSKRPALVVLSKCDLLEEVAPEGPWTMQISSATNQGLDELARKLWEMLSKAPIPNSVNPIHPEEIHGT